MAKKQKPLSKDMAEWLIGRIDAVRSHAETLEEITMFHCPHAANILSEIQHITERASNAVREAVGGEK